MKLWRNEEKDRRQEGWTESRNVNGARICHMAEQHWPLWLIENKLITSNKCQHIVVEQCKYMKLRYCLPGNKHAHDSPMSHGTINNWPLKLIHKEINHCDWLKRNLTTDWKDLYHWDWVRWNWPQSTHTHDLSICCCWVVQKLSL